MSTAKWMFDGQIKWLQYVALDGDKQAIKVNGRYIPLKKLKLETLKRLGDERN